jgi:hypothetical protein
MDLSSDPREEFADPDERSTDDPCQHSLFQSENATCECGSAEDSPESREDVDEHRNDDDEKDKELITHVYSESPDQSAGRGIAKLMGLGLRESALVWANALSEDETTHLSHHDVDDEQKQTDENGPVRNDRGYWCVGI